MGPIGAALQRRREEVPLSTDRRQLSIIQKITFGGDLVILPREARPKYKGRLFWARDGDLLWSRIRAKQGSVCVVPRRTGPIAVSNEYPVYSIKADVADATYLVLLLRSAALKRFLDGISHGGSSKTRIHPSDFEQLQVPLPPLAVQQAIVRQWRHARNQASAALQRADQLEAAATRRLLERLGIPAKHAEPLPRVFSLNWENMERWSLGFLRRSIGPKRGVSRSTYPLTTLGAVGAVAYGIAKSPANRPGQHARPYLRVANVQNGRLDLSEIKYIDVPDSMMEDLRLQPGDLLVCEGNSADLVGRPAIWADEIPDCVHQNHILRVRVNPQVALPEYVLAVMQSPPARLHFRARAKFTTNLASINSTDLKELPVPLPPLDVQRDIVVALSAIRAQAASLRAQAERIAEQTQVETDQMILGSRPVPRRN
jgi:type I restriction enzyme S subunit